MIKNTTEIKMPKFELSDLLYNLPQDQIIDIVGKDIVELMKVWGENYLNKNSLVNMATTLKGRQIFEDKVLREYVFRACLTPDKITELGKRLKFKQDDLEDIIVKCRNYKWKDVSFANNVIEILGISESYLPAEQVLENECEEFEPYDRFYELLDYQFLIKTSLLSWITSRDLSKCLIHMPTGSGKTKTCVHAIIEHWNFHERNKGIILWLAHSEELLRQAIYTFKRCWAHLGSKPITIQKFWGSFNLSLDGAKPNVIFTSIQKYINFRKHNAAFFEEICKEISLVVVDEAHKTSARETSTLIEHLMLKLEGYRNRSLIGLSATPGRSFNDINENKKLAHMFDEKIISISVGNLQEIRREKSKYENFDDTPEIVPYLQSRDILATFERNVIEITEEESNLTTSEKAQAKRDMTSGSDKADLSYKILSKLACNHKRNKRILNKLIKLHEAHLPVLLFACNVEHAKMLTAALQLRKIPAACVLGETKPADRANIISSFLNPENELKILINYEVLTTGFDAPNIKCVFITRPTHSIVLYSQMIGRGLRGPRMGGNKNCLLVDVEDNILKFSNESLAFGYFKSYWRN